MKDELLAWMVANGAFVTGCGYCLESPLPRRLTPDERKLKARAIRWLRNGGARYDFCCEEWHLDQTTPAFGVLWDARHGAQA